MASARCHSGADLTGARELYADHPGDLREGAAGPPGEGEMMGDWGDWGGAA